MNTFLSYLESAIYFLFSAKAFDHILFLVIFSIIFQFREWKSLLSLWCALGIGYTITLFLSGFGIIHFSSSTTSLLLASSILLAALASLLHKGHSTPNALRYNLTVLMGLLQGLGFASKYKAFGKSDFLSVLGFDLGLWLGSFLMILLSLSLSGLLVLSFRGNRRDFNLVFTGMGLGIALFLFWIRY